jgi:hypothetical protein
MAHIKLRLTHHYSSKQDEGVTKTETRIVPQAQLGPTVSQVVSAAQRATLGSAASYDKCVIEFEPWAV